MLIRKLVVIAAAIVAPIAQAQNFEYGVATNLKRYPQSSGFYVEKMKDAGFTSFRSSISWQYVEKEKGAFAIPNEFSDIAAAYDNAPKDGLRPIFILGYGNKLYDNSGLVTTDEARSAFARYAKWIATRFRGKVKYYEIWNEWFTGSRQFGDKSIKATIPDYVKLIEVASKAIKSVDPQAIILAGGADGSKNWFEQFAAQGGLEHIDGLSIHPYNFTQFYKDGFTPEASIAIMQRIHGEFKQAYGKDIPFYVTEVGWPTSQKRYTDLAQAAFVQRYYILARAAGFVRGVWWYELSDGGRNPANNEDNFGLLTYAGTPKASFGSFSAIAKILKGDTAVSLRDKGQDLSAELSGPQGSRSFNWIYKGLPSNVFLKSNTQGSSSQKAGPALQFMPVQGAPGK